MVRKLLIIILFCDVLFAQNCTTPTWTNITSTLPAAVTSNGGIQGAWAGSDGFFYISSNGGTFRTSSLSTSSTWTDISSGIPLNGGLPIGIQAFGETSSGRILGGVGNNGTSKGIYYFNPSGSPTFWVQAAAITSSQHVEAFDYDSAGTVFAVTAFEALIYKSTDDGVTFTASTPIGTHSANAWWGSGVSAGSGSGATGTCGGSLFGLAIRRTGVAANDTLMYGGESGLNISNDALTSNTEALAGNECNAGGGSYTHNMTWVAINQSSGVILADRSKIATSTSLNRSTDGGTTWSSVPGINASTDFTGFAFYPLTSEWFVAGKATSSGQVLCSKDDALTFSDYSNGMGTSATKVQRIYASPANNYKLAFSDLNTKLWYAAPPSGPTLSSITISPASASIAIGAAQTFTAACLYSDSSTTPCGVTWNSASTGIATINSSTGVATGAAAGTSNITAALSGVTSNTAVLTVTSPGSIGSVLNGGSVLSGGAIFH